MSEATKNSKETANQEDATNKETDYHVYPQFIAGFGATLVFLCTGMSFTWPTTALPQLLDLKNDFHITSDEGAWIVSGVQLGACFGPIVSALLVDRIGRKWFIYSCGIPYLISWIIIYFAQSFQVLFSARIINGITIGAFFGSVPMYLGEIAQNKVRGALGTMLILMVSTGTLICFIIGPWVDYQVLSLINMVPIVLFLVTFLWMPESPYYYLQKNKVELAEKSLQSLRKSKMVAEELKEMSHLFEMEQQHRGRITELISVPGNRKATKIMFVLLSAQQLSGSIVFLAYASLFFQKTALEISLNYQVIITGVVTFLSSITATCVVDRLGKKPLLCISSAGVSVCLGAIAIYFYLERIGSNVQAITWIPLASVILFYIFFNFGLGPIPYAILAEIYSTNIKAAATMIASIYGSAVGVVISKLYQVITDNYGYDSMFCALCIIQILFFCTVLFVVPETTGKSLKEIQELLNRAPAKSEKTSC